MRNLKKVLALVMAMALALTMFAGALDTVQKTSDFDELSAPAQEAVSVLSALGVINGYPDGTFLGEKDVSRAELAKMLYVLKTGDTEALFYSNSTLPFNDVAGNWGAAYLNYAYLNGIMVGYGDGTMKPDQTVTGVEAAKMALVALGYNPKSEGLEGSNYYTNTMRLAGVAGLMANVGGNMNEGMSRAETAILLYNALYANTVQYVGGAATPKTGYLGGSDTITLGEEGFDLLDVTGVLVANDEIGVSAYWRDVLKVNSALSLEYKKYDKAASGQSRFVYKDYVAANAANPQGYYIDKVVTVNVDTSFADLGHQFRLLITNASGAYSSTEVRKLYGILGETVNSSNYKASTNTAGPMDDDDVVNLMLARYKQYNPFADNAFTVNTDEAKDDVDGTILINGEAKSFADAIAALGEKTTAPVSYIDNDNDGVVDHLFIAKYTLGIVNAVADDSVTVLGAGVLKTYALTNGDVAKGDYVAYYKNVAEGKYYIKKLTAVSGSITGYDGSKYTVNGAAYAPGTLLPEEDEDFLDGYKSVNSAVYGFAMDEDDTSKYIAKINVTSQTRFEKYAIIVEDDAGGTVLGRPQVKLYNEDNEYVYGYVASIDGLQVYDSASYWTAVNAVGNGQLNENNLVSYIKNGDDIYLYSLTYNGGHKLYSYFYDPVTDTWYDDVRDPDDPYWPYKNENGVVFVTYSRQSQTDRDAYVWRAYKPGEFTIPYGTTLDGSSSRDAMIEVTSNSWDLHYIKAAAIQFFNPQMSLPGLPTQEGRSMVATITGQTGATYDPATGMYSYSYSVLKPWSTSSDTYTTVPMAGVVGELKKGNVYKLYLDSDGKITRYELLYNANGIFRDPGNTIELEGYYAESFYIGLNGQIQITLYPIYGFGGPLTLMLTADSNAFFVKNLGKDTFETVDWTKLVSGVQQLPTGFEYSVVVDFNKQTREVNNIWIDTVAIPAIN